MAKKKSNSLMSWWSGPFDALSMLSKVDMKAMSQGMAFFGKPDAGAMLGLMGSTTEEQVDRIAAMMKNSSEDDIAAMMAIFQQGMAKAQELAQAEAEEALARAERSERSRDRRSPSAERRAQRHARSSRQRAA